MAINDYVTTTRYNAETGYNTTVLTEKGTIAQRLDNLEANTLGFAKIVTAAPTEDNLSGIPILVLLDNEPTTKYVGYIYFTRS